MLAHSKDDHEQLKSQSKAVSENTSYNASPDHPSILKHAKNKNEGLKNEFISPISSKDGSNIKTMPELTLDDLLEKYRADKDAKGELAPKKSV